MSGTSFKGQGTRKTLNLEPDSMKKPSVSVVMPLYNKEHEVGRAIRSVLAQSFTDFELIIVNDGSTDRGVDQVTCFADARIRLVNQNNQGVSAARNRGVAESASDLVAFLDADDEWMPDFLATILRLRTAYPEAGVYATSYLMRSADGTSKQAILRKTPMGLDEGVLSDYFLVAAHSDPPLWTSAVAVDKSAFQKIGGFPDGIRCGEDLLTWARLACSYEIVYSCQPLAVFWMPAEVSDRPGQFDDIGDPVGDELYKLYDNARGGMRTGLRHYLAVWHRMRAVIFLRLGQRLECLHSVYRSVCFGGSNGRLAMVALLAICPYPKPVVLFRALKKIADLQRNRKRD